MTNRGAARCWAYWALLAGVLEAAPSGCSAPPQGRARTFTAIEALFPSELVVGDAARSFALKSGDGKLTRLAAVRGRVTVLAFPAGPEWPGAELHRRLAEIAWEEGVWRIDVVVVSVGRPPGGCAEALGAAGAWQVPPKSLVLVCDPFDSVHKNYGRHAVGQWYVLTNFLKIAANGDLDNLEELRAAVRRTVDGIADQDFREGAWEYYGDVDFD